jgi:hypothetical protein
MSKHSFGTTWATVSGPGRDRAGTRVEDWRALLALLAQAGGEQVQFAKTEWGWLSIWPQEAASTNSASEKWGSTQVAFTELVR